MSHKTVNHFHLSLYETVNQLQTVSPETLIHRYPSFTMDGSVEALRCLVSLKGLNGAAEVVETEPHVLLGHMVEDLEMLRVVRLAAAGTCAEQVVSLLDSVGIENTVNYHLNNEITRAELVHYIMRVRDQTKILISDLEATIQNCKNNVGYTHLEQDDLLVVFVKKRIDLDPILSSEEDEYSKFEDILNLLEDE
ncbi:hypothetical protein Tco_0669853 [Tanacetum coccineum]